MKANKFIIFFLIGIIGIGILITALITVDPFNSLPRQQIFTELYFPKASELPKTVSIGKKLTFQFTIHNLEGKALKYPYQVYVATDGAKQYIDQTELSIKANTSQTITESFVMQYSATRAAVIITLPNQKEHIDFFVTSSQSAQTTL